MDVIMFLLIGLLAGWIASTFIYGNGSGMFLDVFIGAVGALVGGITFRFFNISTNNLLGSLTMSVVGAILLLSIVGMFYKNRQRVKL